jgi:serine/threonine-protein phosphatase 4 regulatory subunit 1
MLGDLLTDVDPCETVEYVLPLLSGFAVDEDEMVKEAFAGEIHRIIWFFFSVSGLLSANPVDN